MPGRPARSAASSAPGAISPARLVLTIRALGFMRARSAAVTMPRVASISRRGSDSPSDSANRAPLPAPTARAAAPPRGARVRHRVLSAPRQHVHAEGLAVAGDDGADLAVAVDAEGLAAQPDADRVRLPLAGPERVHFLWNAPERRDDEPPRELGRRV